MTERTAIPTEKTPRHRLLSVLFVLAIAGLAACGADDAPVETAAATTTVDEDHDDHDDHDDEDHDDHDDEDHDDEDGSGLGAHEHGAAELSVAWIDSSVAIDLISPTFNVFGFEYEPETDDDIALAADQTEALIADGIITVNETASCSTTGPATTEVEYEGSHAEITVSWLFECENPDDVNQIDLSALFAEFPSFEDIDAQWITASDQSSAELTPDSPTLVLES